mmetsp:Transcript_37368/g.73494  ORF Transcript_37368/g.73494 Transcript_37368/m.73494 type:complete len:760 (+) Transcript_37368:73-2352(+)|eukprot:CAMPEP_0175165342 /NCGR_PEP_ID=MMETSP0087-20121206/27024_1 /TAXON_ID=136419 /ORGANISM="Unknown Unknown, Strain D1" /LENGTH=759 /DNA_ID=CAMNT_0016454691 /DNA_START=71 /DNA_END=2350 /DNA_ORIENTATION=+
MSDAAGAGTTQVAQNGEEILGLRAKVNALLDDKYFNLVVIVLTLLALFQDDIRLAFCAKSTDEAFNVVTHIVFSFFIIEWLVSCWCKPDYVKFCWSSLWQRCCNLKVPWFKPSFFFWLDLVASLSMILEMSWFNTLLYGNTAADNASIKTEQLAALKRTKAAKVVRFVRLMRIVRIAKLFERFYSEDDQKSKKKEDSKVASHLSEQTTRKVVIMVLLMLLVIPLLSLITEVDDLGPEHAVRELYAAANSALTTTVMWDASVAWVKAYYASEQKVLSLNVVGTYHKLSYQDASFNDYRYPLELTTAVLSENSTNIGVFSNLNNSQLTATYSLILTFVVLLMLTTGAWLFNRTTHALVIVPLERMLFTIHQLRAKPLAKPVIADEDGDDDGNETGILERTLAQLTGLLQVGFGEAGSRMIAKCMNTDSGDLNPLVDGTKMTGIFGFCDIRRFTDATECLKEDVMMYVNEIADIVHHEVKLLDGNPNKNVGDAFLLVWRLPEELSEEDLAAFVAGKKSSPQITEAVAELADRSLVSFCRVFLEMAASETLKKYKDHAGIKKTFGDNFQVSLGFGLHVGWAIEGPIGSRFKIDASYLSPHVNMCETVQDFCKTYNVPLLLSGEFFSLLSEGMKSQCRRLDRIMTAGTTEPMDIWCFDIHIPSMTTLIETTADLKMADAEKTSKYLTCRNKPVEALQAGIPADFKKNFTSGVDEYVAGNWIKAEAFLKTALSLYPGDGPAVELLGFMKGFSNTAPNGWPGYRDL